MKKKYLFLLTLVGASALIAFGCQKAESEEEASPDQEEIQTQITPPDAKNPTTPTTPTPEIKMNGNGTNHMHNGTTNEMNRVPLRSTPAPMNNGAKTTGIPDSNRINGNVNNANMNNSNTTNPNVNNNKNRPHYGPTSGVLENDPAGDATVQIEISEDSQDMV